MIFSNLFFQLHPIITLLILDQLACSLLKINTTFHQLFKYATKDATFSSIRWEFQSKWIQLNRPKVRLLARRPFNLHRSNIVSCTNCLYVEPLVSDSYLNFTCLHMLAASQWTKLCDSFLRLIGWFEKKWAVIGWSRQTNLSHAEQQNMLHDWELAS